MRNANLLFLKARLMIDGAWLTSLTLQMIDQTIVCWEHRDVLEIDSTILYIDLWMGSKKIVNLPQPCSRNSVDDDTIVGVSFIGYCCI